MSIERPRSPYLRHDRVQRGVSVSDCLRVVVHALTTGEVFASDHRSPAVMAPSPGVLFGRRSTFTFTLGIAFGFTFTYMMLLSSPLYRRRLSAVNGGGGGGGHFVPGDPHSHGDNDHLSWPDTAQAWHDFDDGHHRGASQPADTRADDTQTVVRFTLQATPRSLCPADGIDYERAWLLTPH